MDPQKPPLRVAVAIDYVSNNEYGLLALEDSTNYYSICPLAKQYNYVPGINNNYDVVMAAVNHNGQNLRYASELQQDNYLHHL